MAEFVSRPPRYCLMGAAVLIGWTTPFEPAAAESAGEGMSRIYGGEPAKTCEWPTTVGLGGCTGTLIHPRVVLYAAHCGTRIRTAQFGEQYRSKIAHQIKTVHCKRNPEFKGQASLGRGQDSAYCLLEKEVEGVAIAPVFYGCETEELKPGGAIWLVGFGKNNNKEGLAKAGIKFKVETDFVKYGAGERELVVGSNGKTACNGDSGGPAYLKMSDGSWRTIGITSYGEDTTCTKVAYYSNASKAIPWIQKSLNAGGYSDIDLTPCFTDDGKWEPSEKCGGFAQEPGTAFGKWDNFCSEGAPKSGASSLCGDANPKAGSGSKKDTEAPVLKFQSPEDEQSFKVGDDITVEIKATDNEDKDPDVLISVNGKEQDKLEKGPYKWTLEDLEAGTHTIKATATDEAGNEAEAVEIKVVVQEAEEDDDDSGNDDDSDSGSDAKKNKGGDDDNEDDDDSGKKKGKGKNKGSDDEDDDDDDDPSSDDKKVPLKKKGCSSSAEAPSPGWALLPFAALWGIKRRRRR